MPVALAVAASAVLGWQGNLDYAKAATLACAAVSAATDVQTGYVFDRVTGVGFLLVFALQIADGALGGALAAGAIAGGLLGLVYACSRGRGLGLGDVKLGAALAVGLGTSGALEALRVAAIAGGATALLLWLCGRARFGSAIPFAPFLALGASFGALTCR